MTKYLLARGGGAGGRKFMAETDEAAQQRANKLRRTFGATAKLYRCEAGRWMRL